jgi:hypothetical protein
MQGQGPEPSHTDYANNLLKDAAVLDLGPCRDQALRLTHTLLVENQESLTMRKKPRTLCFEPAFMPEDEVQ